MCSCSKEGSSRATGREKRGEQRAERAVRSVHLELIIRMSNSRLVVATLGYHHLSVEMTVIIADDQHPNSIACIS